MGGLEGLDPATPARAVGGSEDEHRGARIWRVSSEWFNRPDDARYLSFDDLSANAKGRTERSPMELPGIAPANADYKHTSPAQQTEKNMRNKIWRTVAAEDENWQVVLKR